MSFVRSIVISGLLYWSIGSTVTAGTVYSGVDRNRCNIQLSAGEVVLSGVAFSIEITFPPYLSYDQPLPQVLYYTTEGAEIVSNDDNGTIITRQSDRTASLSFAITAKVDSLGYHTLYFNFSQSPNTNTSDLICPTQSLRLLAIPGILTIFPPIITALLAILFRQVLLALLVGIWLCAFLGNRFNPLTALLRTLDTYFVDSLGDPDHAAVVVFTFILGGLIGVVQKSGGGIGMARLLSRFTSTRRRASLVCIFLAACIFFDDYSLILIAGTSLRMIVSSAGVSREKFAYILKSLAPTLPSMVPISSWIGVEVGYMQSTLKSAQCMECDDAPQLIDDPFVLVVRSIPYRFFPWLMIFTVILICILGRDFGCMLIAERATLTIPSQTQAVIEPTKADPSEGPLESSVVSLNNDEKKSSIVLSERGESSSVKKRWSNTTTTNNTELQQYTTLANEEHHGESLYTGSLAPKKNVPYRWFNAVVPFLLTVLVTLIGMIIGGRQKILDLPPDQNVTVSVVNIFTYADSVSSLIWASALSSAVLLIMLLVQRILSMKEFMDSFIAGIQDVIEPTFTFVLAWALGTAMQDIHTNAYIAQALNSGGVRAENLPPLITIIGFLMSFATGSAFGTMGILFPLVIPTVCELESANGAQCRIDIIIQAAAAIMGSAIYGNVTSPLADLTILTVFAAQTTMSKHIKTAILYNIIIGVVAILFGALPVGAGWYPWYAAWIIMTAVMVIIFVLFSSSITSPKSKPLLKRICPWLYSFPAYIWDKIMEKARHCWEKRPQKCQKTSPQNDEEASNESAPLLDSEYD